MDIKGKLHIKTIYTYIITYNFTVVKCNKYIILIDILIASRDKRKRQRVRRAAHPRVGRRARRGAGGASAAAGRAAGGAPWRPRRPAPRDRHQGVAATAVVFSRWYQVGGYENTILSFNNVTKRSCYATRIRKQRYYLHENLMLIHHGDKSYSLVLPTRQ